MKIYTEKDLKNFEFWSGGADRANHLSDDELDRFEAILDSELYPNGIDATNLNDLFWFEFSFVCESLGLDEDEVLDRPIFRERRQQ